MKTIKSLFVAIVLSGSIVSFAPSLLPANILTATTTIAPGYKIIRVYINSQGEKMATLLYPDGKKIDVLARIVGAQDIAF